MEYGPPGLIRFSPRRMPARLPSRTGATVRIAAATAIWAKTAALIAGAEAGSKLDKAQEKGVPVLGEGSLESLLGGTGLAEVLASAP